MKHTILAVLISVSLAGSVTRWVKYDAAASDDAERPCFEKGTVKWSKGKAILMDGARYREEEKGDWKYWSDEGVHGLGIDADEKFYMCMGEKQAETPSGVKCEQVDSSFDINDGMAECNYDNYVMECDYDPDEKTGHPTVEDMEADMEKNKQPSDPTIVEMQMIFWECAFDSADVGTEVSADCTKAKLVKTKHDGTDAEKCFANKGMVSALLMLVGLMN